MSRFVTPEVYIQYHSEILADLRKQIVDGFSTLDSVKMNTLEQAVHYRKKLINFAKSGIQKEFLID